MSGEVQNSTLRTSLEFPVCEHCFQQQAGVEPTTISDMLESDVFVDLAGTDNRELSRHK
jgi:hypothetical protein